MKTIPQLGLVILLAFSLSSAWAITTTVPAEGEVEMSDAVTARFGLKGRITRYVPDRQIIVINQAPYRLARFAKPADLELKPGLRVYYNIEISAPDGQQTVTRIWAGQEKRK